MKKIDSFRIELDMEQMMCSSCKKSSSEYFEMVLHLRYKYFNDNMKLKEESIKILENNFNSINKIEEIENGFDVYFKDHGQMGKINNLFNKKYNVCFEKRSSKIMGKDNLTSKDLFRHFQSLTIVNINRGDKVRIKGEDYYIKAINKGGKLILRRLDNGAKEVMSYSIIEEYFSIISSGNYE